MGRTCQLIFSPSITTMLLQCMGELLGARVRTQGRTEGEKGARWANFDSKRRSRAEGGLLAVYRSVLTGEEQATLNATLAGLTPDFKPPTTNGRALA